MYSPDKLNRRTERGRKRGRIELRGAKHDKSSSTGEGQSLKHCVSPD